MKKVYVPGSKSITNRALLLAALGNTPMELWNVLDSDDARYMQVALRQLGVQIEEVGENRVRVTPPPILQGQDHPLFIGNAGTAARFLSALSLVVEGTYELSGVERMHERPQSDLMAALENLGVKVEFLGKAGFLPARLGRQARNEDEERPQVSLSGKVSSQFLSGLMLVAPAMKHGLTIEIIDSIPSRPYVEMTIALLQKWGAKVSVSDDFLRFEIAPGLKNPGRYEIPSDMSSASYPLAWSVLRGVPITIENFGAETLQGDEQFLAVIETVGAKIERVQERLKVMPPNELKAMGDWNWEAMPDVSMTGMVLAAFCPGTAQFTGLESLRVKECDRIEAMAQLQDLGVNFQVCGDEVRIQGNEMVSTDVPNRELKSFDDHRIAMCMALYKAKLALGADPHQKSQLQILEPECVGKTWPDFWVHLADWEDQLRPVSALILSREDKFLVVKKPRKHNAWQFPQGGVDPGETGKQAAVRELQEECGQSLTVKIIGERPVGDYRYLFPPEFDRHEAQIVGAKVSFFKAEYISGEVEVDGVEIIDYAWVPPEALENYFETAYLEAVQHFY